ncbi:Gfo/Idh/MocA family protein [Gulosibacter chungangensis]|uniref:Gfo/Idh/MocA family oxidoreductase n=1 Tax=Gulosibacter chungangensis TaxID=979746 RepID=A0A7J5BFZ0_9MICO|nr:Gfo/Idh/MocA family oxidoreductase [Gulosibacter chungangensis]KAB1645203.1 Gfo/Idh/MocA family oxidoreductase [Gulosibacter chungangensis]
MTSTTLRCAIVGTGDAARLHAEAILAHPAAELSAVTSLNLDVARAFAKTWGEPAVYDSLESLLAEAAPDVVLLCTPPATHADAALAAFAAGAHVICEKPPATSLVDVRRMEAAARAAGREFAVVFQQRSGTATQHVQQLLRSGAVGRPLVAQCNTLWYRPDAYFDVPWRGTWASEGAGTLLQHGIHQVDLLNYLAGPWAAASGRLWRLARDTETEDTATGTIQFASGLIAQVTSTVLAPRQSSAIRIDTELATIELEHLYGHGHANWRITPAPDVPEAVAAGWQLPEAEVPSGHTPILHGVLDALATGSALPDIATGASESFGLLTAMYQSAQDDGRLVRPDELTADNAATRSLRAEVTELRPEVTELRPDASQTTEIFG